MTFWRYIIKANSGDIITQDYHYAEEKSKLGYQVFCKREHTISRYPH